MTKDTDTEYLCTELVKIMEEIVGLLALSGEDPSNYGGFEKVKNIARSRDQEGFKNAARYLDDEYRIIYENRISSNDIDKKMAKAYMILDRVLGNH